VRRAIFGYLPDGRTVHELALSNARGITVRILSYGAIIQSLYVPDRYGTIADVVLGYSDVAGYVADPNYVGAVIGRYANRIAGGRFVLESEMFSLARNDGDNSLHGGSLGFGKQLWSIEDVREGPCGSVTLRYVSVDGEEGYPGTLSTTATYSLDDDGCLALTIEAETDKPTIANLTGHSYFNLAGEASGVSALGHRLYIDADRYTPIDRDLIPTGVVAPVARTPLDFRQASLVGARIREARHEQIRFGKGYDHNFILSDGVLSEPKLAARLEEPNSGRSLEIWTNQPGLQFYSGNFLSGAVVGKSGSAYRQSDALALEPQLFPDTPNQPTFGSAQLLPGQLYRNQIGYRFLTSPREPVFEPRSK
jgi:aldose 1-epimerase